MTATTAFCTDYAIAQEQPLAGTGAMALRHLFIRWPKGKWRRPRYESVGIEPVLGRAIHESYGPGRYVGLVESDGGPDLELVSFSDSLTAQPATQEEAAAMIRAWAEGVPLNGPSLPRPVILCCTDAKVNACCARYGFPIYKALRDGAGAVGYDVMQTTHFGGCHFAPSVIVMPQRSRYGRLSLDRVPEFLAALGEGRYYLDGFKGRPDIREIEQCAEIAAWQWAEASGMDQSDVSVIAPGEEVGSEAVVFATARDAKLRIDLVQRSFHQHGTCRSLAEDEGKTVVRWVVTAVTPI